LLGAPWSLRACRFGGAWSACFPTVALPGRPGLGCGIVRPGVVILIGVLLPGTKPKPRVSLRHVPCAAGSAAPADKGAVRTPRKEGRAVLWEVAGAGADRFTR
jgi:hypothetical protein